MLLQKTENLLLSTAYLPPIEYIARIAYCNQVYIEQWENYPKQTYRNRCIIAAAGGPLALILPVEKPTPGHCHTRDIRISNHGNWRHIHWNALVSAYQSSPFFEYYADDFAPFYEKQWKFLLDYNEELLTLLCTSIGFTPKISRTETYHIRTSTGLIQDFRETIHPKRPTSNDFRISPYYQVFKAEYGFQANLSAVDLLFNMGPESILTIRESFREPGHDIIPNK